MSTQPNSKTRELHAWLAELQQKRQRKEEEKRRAEEQLRKEAKIEAELLRQIAVEEERERQEADAAERERVAEEIWKLEEEERQRWEAEHRVEAVRQVQAPESLMWVDDGSGDDGDAEEETETKKGKGKETEKGAENGWMIVGGSGRCKACWKEETACKINLGEIEKWWKSTEKGKVYKKAPPTTSCQRCTEVRRKPCILPATEECRRKMEKSGKPTKLTVAPSASSGGKRPLEDTDRGLLLKKKQKKAEEKMLMEEEFRMEVADALGSIAVDAAHFARAAELQNFLLQQLVEALGGSGTAFGKLPEEGKLEKEDKADELYKVDESEEGSEEESGEESGEGSEE